MAQVLSIRKDILSDILSALRELKQDVAELKEKLAFAPPYGTKQWWDWSNQRALISIRKGKGVTIRNQKELDEFFDRL